MKKQYRHKDLAGMTFGRLTVLERSQKKDKHRRAIWDCICSCGNHTTVTGANLRSGYTKSCGCLKSEIECNVRTNPNGSVTRLYQIWAAMKSRCKNKDNKSYKYYGGVGISICDSWEHFPVFNSWAMDNGYRDNLTIDRIKNEVGYNPDNCRWATMQKQAENRRYNKTRGVSWHNPSGKWYARFIYKHKVVFAKLFIDFEDACAAIKIVRKEYIP